MPQKCFKRHTFRFPFDPIPQLGQLMTTFRQISLQFSIVFLPQQPAAQFTVKTTNLAEIKLHCLLRIFLLGFATRTFSFHLVPNRYSPLITPFVAPLEWKYISLQAEHFFRICFEQQ